MIPISKFENFYKAEILNLQKKIYAPLKLTRFRWEPCRHIESLEQNCPKFVWKDQQIKGYAAAYRLDETHFRLNLLVPEKSELQRMGTALLQMVEAEIIKIGGKFLQFRILENFESSFQFALQNGFEEIHRMRGMSLSAADFISRQENPNLRKFSLTTLEDEIQTDALQKLVELHIRARRGWENPDPTWKVKSPKRFFESLFTKLPHPELFSILKLGGQFIAYTSAARQNKSATAVHPDFRNSGIATYLKSENLKICLAAGERYFETSSANPAMWRVNEKLGYKFNGLTEIRLLKRLSILN